MSRIREIKLLTISELSHEILIENTITIHHWSAPTFVELLEQIWDLHPGLYHEQNYDLYYRLTPTNFVRMYDWFSYFTAMTMMAENTFYMLLRDSEPWCNGQMVERKRDSDNAILFKALINGQVQKTRMKYFTNTIKQCDPIVDDEKLGCLFDKKEMVPPDDNIINQRPKLKPPSAKKKGKGKGKDAKKDKKKKK